MIRRRVFALLAAGALLAGLPVTPAGAQEAESDTATGVPHPAQAEDLRVPEGWRHRPDDPSEEVELVAGEEPGHAAVRFVTMEPGWHVTTGPRLILYRPDDRAEGDFRASMTTHLFDPGRRNEAYGIFVGGRHLDGPDQRYLYFLVRRSGEFLVKLRDGDDTRLLVDWTPHDAVVAYEEREGETARNTLSVEARGDSVRFSVNGTEVATRSRAGLPVDGIVGWRINHRLDLHVSDFTIEEPNR